MSTSLYPNQIDNSTSIPVVTDNVTPVNAEVINRLRDAIIAIESEAGINPSGTYGTVKARLDALEALIAAGGGGGGGGTAVQVQETIAVTAPGQTSFILSQIPAQASAVQMYLNGSKLEEGAEYNNTSTTTTVTYTGLIPLSITDVVEFYYLVDLGGIVPTSNLQIKDSGVAIESAAASMDFTGNVTVTSISAGVVEVNVPNAAVAVENNGTPIELSTNLIDFTGNVTVTSTSPGEIEVNVPTPSITVENNGTPVDSSTLVIDTVGKLVSTSVSPGNVQFEVPESKIRVYIDSSNFSGAASGVDQVITWNGTSTKITSTNASLSGGTQLTTTKSGTYLVQGQLTIQPTADSISSITINVIHNGLTDVHTIYDAGAVWGTGINRSFSFNFPMELAASDTLEVTWQHTGSALSATDLVFGDNLSWFSIILV